MSGLALMEVQRALYTKLQGDGVLMGMVAGVYDNVPQTTALPYVVIGDGRQDGIAADAVGVSQCRLVLDVWTDIGGRKTALVILNRLFSLMHMGTLSMGGYQLVMLRVEHAETTLREQGTRMHGMLVISAIVTEN